MNRRGFFAFLAAAPAAAVAGLRSKGPVGWWGRETFKRHRGPAMTTKQWSRTVAETSYDMPETKPIIDEDWRRFNKEFWGES